MHMYKRKLRVQGPWKGVPQCILKCKKEVFVSHVQEVRSKILPICRERRGKVALGSEQCARQVT